MKKDLIRQIVLHLESKGLLSTTEDELVDQLYGNNDDRKEILKALISLFSEDYRTDLLRADSLDNEIAQKMHELEIVTKEKRLHFVLGKCTKEEQKAVYENMFKALNLVLIAQEHGKHQSLSATSTENVSKQGIKLSANMLKQLPKKKFNLEQALQNLEKTRNTLLEVSQFMDHQDSKQDLNMKENEESKLLELYDRVDAFHLMMEKQIQLMLNNSKESHTIGPEFGHAVDKLHAVLQFIAESTKPLPSEGIDLEKRCDLEKLYTQAKQLEKNLVVFKCFSKTLICEVEEKSINE